MGPNEPFWRTNSSFSPPPFSTHWDFHVQSEELPYESDVHNITTLYDLSFSSEGGESENWVISNEQNQISSSDDSFSYTNSPDSFQNQQLKPPPVQGVYFNDYVRESLSTRKTSARFTEGPSVSDDSDEYEPTPKSQASSRRSFTSCCSFMSKAVHPEYIHEDEDEEFTAPHSHATSYVSSLNIFGGSRCGLCDKFLFQRSPYGTCKLIYSGDMPVSSVLSCSHVYHAECLERITPKTQKHDPPCPICDKLGNNNIIAVENWAICRMKSGLPSLRSLGEEGTSRVWSCGQKGDFVEGASRDVPRRSNSMLLRNRSRMKRQLSLKGENARRSIVCSPRLSIGEVGCSSAAVK